MYYRKLQILFFLFCTLIGFALFMHTYDDIYDGFIGIGMGQMDYPRLLLGGWIIMSSLICVQLFFTHTMSKDNVLWKEVFIALGIVILFLVLYKSAGFFISSSVFFLLFSFFLGFRNLIILIPLGIGYSLGIYLLFIKILEISLPASPFGI